MDDTAPTPGSGDETTEPPPHEASHGEPPRSEPPRSEPPRGELPPQTEVPPPGSSPGSGPPSPPPPPPPPPRRLTRDTRGAVLGGVAGGIGRHLGIDPVVVRLAFIGAALLGGTGVLLYLIAWVIVPGDDEDPAVSHDERRDAGEVFDQAVERIRTAPLWVQITGILFVALLIAGQGGGVPASVTWAVVLIAGGALLFRASDRREAQGSAHAAGAPPAGDSTWAGGRWTGAERPFSDERTADSDEPYWTRPLPADQAGFTGPGGGGGSAGGGGSTAASTLEAMPPTPRPRSILGRLTIALVLVVGGAAALLEDAGAIDLEPHHYVAGALIGLGLGLLVGAWVGRARGLIALGVLLLPVLFIASLPVLPVGGGVGERIHAPTTSAALEPGYALGIGRLAIDLTEVPGSGPLIVTAELGVGELEIVVPEGADVDVTGSLGGGEAQVLGRRVRGTEIDLDAMNLPEGGGRPVTLDIRQGIGALHVRSR